jgi:hypothetical protein
VDVALDAASLFAGELPVLRVEVRAPAAADVIVVRPERAAAFGYLFADLIDPNGKRVPGGLPDDVDTSPQDLFTLRGGRAIRYRAHVLARPPVPGKYTVRASFQPTGDRAFTIKRDFELTCRSLPERDIVGRTAVEIPAGADKGRDRSSIEFLMVREGKALSLFYRRSWPDRSAELQRVTAVDESAQIKAEAVGLDAPRAAGRIKLTISGKGHQSVRWLDYYTGIGVGSPPA